MRIILLLLFLLFFSSPAGAWVIDGDRIYVDDAKAYISATPHTLRSSDWVYFNISSKNWSGNVDIAFGFNTSNSKPRKAELYNPQTIQLPNTTNSKTVYNVTEIFISTQPPDFGNEYNIYRRKINYSVPNPDNVSWQTMTAVVAFDSCVNETGQSCIPFIPQKNYTVTWNTTHSEYREWQNVASLFNVENWNYDNFSTWYYATDFPVVAGQHYTLRVYMNLKINSKGKYGFGIKPSVQTLQQAKDSGNLYYLDPWWNTSWTYSYNNALPNATRPYQYSLNISNNTAAFGNTTHLNVACFQANCTDLRFVRDNATEEPFWRETNTSVNGSGYATFWFNATANGTGFQIYTGATGVTDASNGTNTFPQWHGAASANFNHTNSVQVPFIYEGSVRRTATGSRTYFGVGDSWNPQVGDVSAIFPQEGDVDIYGTALNNGVVTSHITSVAWTVGTFYHIKIVARSSAAVDYYKYNDTVVSGTVTSNIPDGAMGLLFYVYSGTAGSQEWSFVRTYASPEPTWSSWGTAETQSTPTPTPTPTPIQGQGTGSGGGGSGGGGAAGINVTIPKTLDITTWKDTALGGLILKLGMLFGVFMVVMGNRKDGKQSTVALGLLLIIAGAYFSGI